jgi:hypothetical protein
MLGIELAHVEHEPLQDAHTGNLTIVHYMVML